MNNDLILLRRYAQERSEEAFTQLVQKHCNLVWGAAYRVLGDHGLAQDAAQMAFTDLARKATRVDGEKTLAGWLYRASWLAASKIARRESRRQQREKHAMLFQETSKPAANEAQAVTDLQPMLDAALADLDADDRAVIVQRYLAGQSLAELGQALGASEEAARKRVARALEKLRETFRQRGVQVSGGVMAAALEAAGQQSAPLGLPLLLAGGALATAHSTSVLSLALIMKTKLILELATGAALVALLVWQHSSLNQLRADNAALQKRLSEPAAVLAEPAPPAGGAADALELARLRNEHNELIRLRGKVGQQAELQSQLSAARQALDKNDQAEQAKELDTRMIQTTRNAAVVFRDFARHPGGFDPTNFDQVTAHYGQTHPDSMSRDPNWDLFEFVPHPKPVEQYPESVVLREKTPRQAPAGTWLRAYLTGDGSGFDLVSPTSDFSSQENRSPNVPGIWVEIPGSRGPTPANDARGRANPSSAR